MRDSVSGQEYRTLLDDIVKKYAVDGKTKRLQLEWTSQKPHVTRQNCIMFDCLDKSGDAERTAWLDKLNNTCFG